MDDLWQNTLEALDRGDFTRLHKLLGGPEGFDSRIAGWFDERRFATEPEMLAEALTCSCMLGRASTARYLIERGVDPYAGMKTGMAGPHYAAGGGHLEIVQMLIDRRVPLEVKNRYGGTVLGQALWSAVNDHTNSHADIVEALIDAGAVVETGTLEWWNEQDVPSPETKERVAETLRSTEIA
jgi:hypothetical protein